ncbi:MAG: IS1380 family transposase [Candidatus Xenobiia bacterium LiM19]
MTQCNTSHSILSRLSLPIDKEISFDFDGGNVTSDTGLLLLAEIDSRTGLTDRIASCIKDTRQQSKITHTIREMLQQRVFQICCGYEDCNDAQTLRKDTALKIAVGKRPEKDGDLSSQPTLSRFENTLTAHDLVKIGEQLIECFKTSQYGKTINKIIIDCDATDDPTHGSQQMIFFHGYYDCYCYLPLIVCATVNDENKQYLVSLVRPSDIYPGKKSLGIISRIINCLKKAFPEAEIVLRADSGFALPEIYEWCERNEVSYVYQFTRQKTITSTRSDRWFLVHISSIRLESSVSPQLISI